MPENNGQSSQAGLARVLQTLQDQNQSLPFAHLDALSDLKREELKLFLATWGTLSNERRHSLLTALIETAEDVIQVTFNSIFRVLLNDPDPWVRAHSLKGLWEDDDVRLIDPFIRMLAGDPDPLVRATAATSLGYYALMGEYEMLDADLGMRVREALLDVLEGVETDTDVRRRALESLAYFSIPSVNNLIEEAYDDDDSSVRVSAVFAMGRSANVRWRQHVLDELDNPDDEIRFEAIRASGELEISEALPQLIKSLDENDVELRDAAVWALGQIGGPEARRVLEACCESLDDDLREAAEDALEELDLFSGLDELPAFFFNFDLDD